ncbi:FAD-dependent pyridine nucleotide-disulfide oxidoreductase [Corynebacterium sp. HMSC058E07]|uniref:NAD(P)/FAD-dependent oxidoreductase n=1 Tax=Corynebacterium sp. HMSC058E07 TaxID=1715157 RepID=UPI0008A3EC5B|nr:NAD(P)/FAD-dependent oxidoreductase [Corynebacterium sp. HMSC058E07]OFM59055.1 FAD-dependent pyridine nucleotide-disulfide oxidoreductase [Corynebacterium sp. HMSC058E07]
MENNTAKPLDVLIVGGGFAGTAAGVTLARAQRRVAIVDSGKPRNRFSAHAHGIMGRDGVNPMELLDQGRSEFASFGGEVIPGEVTALDKVGSANSAWKATTTDGQELLARQVLVATGITDELPDVPGLTELWGSRVVHCPYCHGYEVRGRDLAVIGGKNPGFTMHMVHLMRKWTDRVTFFTNGLSLDEADRALFEKRGVVLMDAPVSGVQPDPASDTGVLVSTSDPSSSDGSASTTRAFEACFTGPDFHPNDQLLLAAGCESENGWVVRQPRGQTSVAGLWTAGNVTSSPDQVSQAMGAGVATAIAIDQALLDEELQQVREQAHE